MSETDVMRAGVQAGMWIGLVASALSAWLFYAGMAAALVIVTRHADAWLKRAMTRYQITVGMRVGAMLEMLVQSLGDINAAIVAIYVVVALTRAIEQTGATYPWGGSYWLVYFLGAVIFAGFASGVRFGRHLTRRL